jgi:hypothetical protein
MVALAAGAAAPSPGGAAARRAERPTRVTGTIRPDPGSSWSARRPPARPQGVPAGRRPGGRGRTTLTPGASGRVVFPPGEGIGRTRPGAGSRPRRGRFRPSDHYRHWQFLSVIRCSVWTDASANAGTRRSSLRSDDYGHRRGSRGFGKNRPSGFRSRSRSRFTSVTRGVRRRLRRTHPNHRVAGMYSSTRIPAGPCINRTPVGSMSCQDSWTWCSGMREA